MTKALEHIMDAWRELCASEIKVHGERLAVEETIRSLGGIVPPRPSSIPGDRSVARTNRTTAPATGRTVREIVHELGAAADVITMDDIQLALRADGADRKVETVSSILSKMKAANEIDAGPTRGSYRLITKNQRYQLPPEGPPRLMAPTAADAAMTALRKADGRLMSARQLHDDMQALGWRSGANDPMMIVRNTMRDLVKREGITRCRELGWDGQLSAG